MNKRGTVVFYLFMLFIVFIILALALAKPLSENSDEVKNRIMLENDYINLSNGLIAHYKLNENSTTQIDSSGNGNDATVNNPPSEILLFNESGKIGGAYGNDGTGVSNITFANTSLNNINSSGNYSFSIWARIGMPPINSNPTYSLIGYSNLLGGGFQNSTSIDVTNNSNDVVRVQFMQRNQTNLSQTLSSNLTQGVWYHVVAVYDSNSFNTTLYINGLLNATSTGVVWNPDPDGNLWHLLSRLNTASNTVNANASLDDVRIYNRTLSKIEISTIYNNVTGTEANSVLTFTTEIDCDNVTSSDYQNRAVCTQLDSFPWFFVLIVLGLALIIIKAVRG